MYALKVTCKRALSGAGSIITLAGTVVWVTKDDWSWSSSHWVLADCSDLVTFDTREDAEKAAKKWKGHPWYYEPAKVEVVEVEPIYRQVLQGWKEV